MSHGGGLGACVRDLEGDSRLRGFTHFRQSAHLQGRSGRATYPYTTFFKKNGKGALEDCAASLHRLYDGDSVRMYCATFDSYLASCTDIPIISILSYCSDLLKRSYVRQNSSDFELLVKYITDLKPEERILVSGCDMVGLEPSCPGLETPMGVLVVG